MDIGHTRNVPDDRSIVQETQKWTVRCKVNENQYSNSISTIFFFLNNRIWKKEKVTSTTSEFDSNFLQLICGSSDLACWAHFVNYF